MSIWREKQNDRNESFEPAARALEPGILKKTGDRCAKAPEEGLEALFAGAAHLSAQARRFEEAWAHFRSAAANHLAECFGSKAVAAYTQAARFMPRNPEVWETMAHIYMRQGRKADAVATLYKGHGFYVHGPESARAVAMLRKAFEIEPWNFHVTLSLALLVKNVDPAEALGLLEGLSARAEGRDLRKVRSAMFCAEPSFTMAWRWIKTAWPHGLGAA